MAREVPIALPSELEDIRRSPDGVLVRLGTSPSHGEARIVALETLAARADISEETFRSAFLGRPVWGSDDEHVRWLAVKAVRSRAPEDYAERLLEALEDPSWLVREHAVAASLEALRRMREAGLRSLAAGTRAWRDDLMAEVLFFLRAKHSDVRTAVRGTVAAWTARDPTACLEAFAGRLGPTQGGARMGTEAEARSVPAGLVEGLLPSLAAVPAGVALVETESFARLSRAFRLGLSSGEAGAREALAAHVAPLVRVFAERGEPVPESTVALAAAFLRDPNPHTRARIDAALDEPALLAALLASKEFLAGPAQAGTGHVAKAPPAVAVTAFLRAAARHPWALSDRLDPWRHHATDLATRYAGGGDFRVRRAARALLSALGPGLVPSLVGATRAELSRLPADAPLARRLRAAGDPLLFRWICEEAGVFGAQECLEALDEAARSGRWNGRPAAARALEDARGAVRARLFALRSFVTVLWQVPERDSDAGAPVRAILEEAAGHPTAFIREAATRGR